MIRSLLLAAVVAASSASAQTQDGPADAPRGREAPADAETDRPASAPEPDAEKPKEEASVDRYRTPVEVLTERLIGTASKSVRFDWRRSKIGFGVIGSELLERNNFGTTRVGGFARTPFGSVMGEIAITRAFTWGTDSTEKLAQTPYRQYGRPTRFELDVNVGYPVAEGVVTALPSFFPPTEMVFSGYAGFRYLFYPGALGGARFVDVVGALVAPQLTQRELDKLEESRPGGMQIDPARYGVLAGASLDLYFQTGGFISPRVMIAVPILAPVTETGLGWWWELTLALGWAI